MLNTNLTTIRWKKSLYYISEGVIFDIQNIKRTNDMDNCGSFLIDFSRADNVSKDAVVGATVNLTNQTELFTGIPWLEVKFSEPELDISVPFQYLIEEGDTFTLNNVGQSHPNAYAKDYRNKFNQDFFETIRTYVNRTPLNYGETLVNQIMNILPAWLTCDAGVEMTRNYVINSFVKGNPWNSEQAINGNDDVITLTGVTLKTPMGDASISGSWNKEKIENIVRVLVAVRDVNKLNISSELMEAMLDLIIENNVQTGNGDKLNSLYHIDYDNVGSIIDSEILAKVTDANTYWQYQTTPEPETQVLRANSIAQFKEVGAAHPGEEILFTCKAGCIKSNASSGEGFYDGSCSFIDDGTDGLMLKPLENTTVLEVGPTFSFIDFPCAYFNDNGTPIMFYNIYPTTYPHGWDTSIFEIRSTIKNTNLIGKLVSIEVWNSEQVTFDGWILQNPQTINVTQIAEYSYGDDRICITNWFGLLKGVTIPVGKLTVTGFVIKDGDAWQIFPRDCEDVRIIPIRHVNNIQEFKELGNIGHSDICIDGDVTVVYQNGKYIMIEDNTGGLMVDDSARYRITNVYNPGDIISGGITGICVTGSVIPKFVPSHNWKLSTNHTTINSIEVNNICSQSLLGKLITIDVYNETEYQFNQETASKHTVNQISNNESIVIYNGFKTMNIVLPVGNIKVTGFVGNRNIDEWQIWCRDNNDIQIISEPEIEND